LVISLKGVGSAEQVAAAIGCRPDEVEAVLAELAGDGLLACRRDRYSLTPEGRVAAAKLQAAERAALDKTFLDGLYARFDEVNTPVKEAITAWQLRPDGQLNDHRDREYDDSVMDRILVLHDQAEAVIASGADQLGRLSRYSERLSGALRRTRQGDEAWLTSPLLDSYHSIWFELHEDLIRLCGRTREE
jgi:pyruvate,orthophosphate dikinase